MLSVLNCQVERSRDLIMAYEKILCLHTRMFGWFDIYRNDEQYFKTC
jgi:hypothetical protein